MPSALGEAMFRSLLQRAGRRPVACGLVNLQAETDCHLRHPHGLRFSAENRVPPARDRLEELHSRGEIECGLPADARTQPVRCGHIQRRAESSSGAQVVRPELESLGYCDVRDGGERRRTGPGPARVQHAFPHEQIMAACGTRRHCEDPEASVGRNQRGDQDDGAIPGVRFARLGSGDADCTVECGGPEPLRLQAGWRQECIRQQEANGMLRRPDTLFHGSLPLVECSPVSATSC